MTSRFGGENRPRDPITSQDPDPSVAGIRLLRLRDVLKVIPISRSSWYAGITAGRFPKGYEMGPRVKVWPSDEIEAIVRAICR